jgi:ArsR family transcriptional regulator, arsenate/arsenite/antimonite-responsive transcriptional repressor
MNVEENRLSSAHLLRITKALADPQRFAILERIAAEPEVACKQLVAEFSITQATISHHLKELVAADLIESRRVGQCAMLSRRQDVLSGYLEQLNVRLLPSTGNKRHGKADQHEFNAG